MEARKPKTSPAGKYRGFASRKGAIAGCWMVAIAATCFVANSDARITHLMITERLPFAGGVEFGTAGTYERLKGTAFMEVDPRDPLNAVITDLDKAPRNGRGMVEFSSPFLIIKPLDMAKGNHKIFSTVNNRGGDGLLNATTVAPGSINELYLRSGYVIVDIGWEGDLVPSSAILAANLPTAANADGSSIVGPMRIEYSDRNLPASGTFSSTLKGNAGYKSYETADTNTMHSMFTMRDTELGSPKLTIPSNRWAFGTCPTGPASLTPSTFNICYFDGFRYDKVYELIYPAKNPIVMALGHAATRDFTSFLRYSSADDVGTPNPLGPGIRRAYATGASQTGAFLRDFIYYGFNEDESDRKVFDGIIPTIAGGIRNHLNVRFADPDVYSDRDFHHDFMQVAYPPFAYGVTTDPISGVTDGIMKRPATDPFLFQIDSGSEFWQLQGSLTQVDGLGNPVSLPPNVRMYFNSSTAHGFATGGVLIGPAGTNPLCANPTPGGSIADTSRALTVALDEWVDQGIAPPPSNHPRIENGTLVSLADYVAAFPSIPFIGKPTSFNTYQLLNWGPTFTSAGGIRSIEPPGLGPSYAMFVPKADADGLDIAGVRPMPIRVPLGTNTGWNVRNATHRPQDSLCGLTGTYVPFATTLAERLATGDPRPSLQERYTDHGGFVYAVSVAAKQLVLARFLLMEDFYKYVQGAATSDVLRTAAEACSNLNGTAVLRASIGLPTTGANVTSTQLIAATSTVGEYCQVLGSIHPVDPTAPDIRFQLNLPTLWNTRSLMFGGGGYDGSIATGTGNVPAGPIDRPIPLARGYATFGSDSGHQANAAGSRDGSFAANDEAMNNFNGDALKKTFDAATFLIAQRYKRTPARSYFAGGSSGGREAFAVVQRWPQNFDGAISLYPAWNAASLDLQFGRLSRAFAAPGAYPNENKKTLLYNSVMTACDALDGLADGIITATTSCHFDPNSIRCPGGADTGDSCLSDAQIAAYSAYNTEITFSYPLGSGETHYPGFNVFSGAETRGVLYLGTTPPTNSPGNPSILSQPYWGTFWEQWVRFFVTRDPLYNALTLDPQNPGIWQSRVSLLTQLQDVNRTDLSAFQSKGGKLLIAHGNADALVSTRSTEEYWSRLISTLTAPVVSTFARYYEIPGYGHASGTAFTAAWDSLTALENWNERGVAPTNQVVADANAATRGRTRPLCEYPLLPRYNGTGDINAAASFTCATFP
jgi:Tannase and feruloyl esterase/Alpha/beta hydrolase domain